MQLIRDFFQVISEEPWSHLVVVAFAIPAVYGGTLLGEKLRCLLRKIGTS